MPAFTLHGDTLKAAIVAALPQLSSREIDELQRVDLPRARVVAASDESRVPPVRFAGQDRPTVAVPVAEVRAELKRAVIEEHNERAG